jgi:ribosomal protein S13
MVSLAKANVVRLGRAEHKRRLRAEGLPAALEMIDNPPEHMQTCTLAVFLNAMRGIGDYWMRKILYAAGVSEKRTLGSLTPHSRTRLAQALSCAPLQGQRIDEGPRAFVDNSKLRVYCERRVAGGETWADLALLCGARKNGGGKAHGDVGWLKRMVGLGLFEGKYKQRITYKAAVRIAEGLGADPHEVGI